MGKDGDQTIGEDGLRATIEQMKARLWKQYQKFSINIYYNPDIKKTSFKFGGFDSKEDNALSKTKGMIIGKMEPGNEYMVKDIKDMAKDSRCVYEAIKELVETDKVLGWRGPIEDERLESGRKMPSNTKIYYLLAH
jgi:hypothetical protein